MVTGVSKVVGLERGLAREASWDDDCTLGGIGAGSGVRAQEVAQEGLHAVRPGRLLEFR